MYVFLIGGVCHQPKVILVIFIKALTELEVIPYLSFYNNFLLAIKLMIFWECYSLKNKPAAYKLLQITIAHASVLVEQYDMKGAFLHP